MLDGGGGSGYSGTNWTGYDVRQMWSMVASQQTDPHWELVSGWRKTFELTSMHLFRLKEYREKLTQAWPPERSAASAAYVAHLDYLIGHVEQTYEAAMANYHAFSGATGALSTTRYELKKIYDEFQANQSKLDDYQLQLDAASDPANSGLAQPGVGPSPVRDGRQEELNNKARSLMYSLSTELIQARAAIRQPPPYKPPRSGVQEGDSDAFGGGGSALGLPPPPVIPPVTVTPPPATPAPPGPGAVTPPVGGGAGPSLGGVGTLPAPGTVNPTLPPQAPTVPTPPGGGIIGGPLPPTVPPVVKPTPSGLIGTPTPALKPVSNGPAAIAKPMAPGGVIGQVNQPVTGQPGGRAAAPRVNPVGGVIGGPASGAAGGRPGGLGGSGMGAPHAAPTGRGPGAGVGRGGPTGAATQPYGAGPAGRHRRGDADEQPPAKTWDPDNPWETDAGVEPVVLPPPPAGRVDPGPAIGSGR